MRGNGKWELELPFFPPISNFKIGGVAFSADKLATHRHCESNSGGRVETRKRDTSGRQRDYI